MATLIRAALIASLDRERHAASASLTRLKQAGQRDTPNAHHLEGVIDALRAAAAIVEAHGANRPVPRYY